MSDARELAGRALAHFNNGTTDLAPEQLRIPIDAYTDEARFEAERQAVFFRITDCYRSVCGTTRGRGLSDANRHGRATSADT